LLSFQDVLGRLHEVLSSLRNRLKYAAQLRSARAELAEALAGVGTRDEEIEHHVQEKAQLRCEADAAVKDSIRLAKRNQQWQVKHVRLGILRTTEHHSLKARQVQQIEEQIL
jgi:hypothetical protein